MKSTLKLAEFCEICGLWPSWSPKMVVESAELTQGVLPGARWARLNVPTSPSSLLMTMRKSKSSSVFLLPSILVLTEKSKFHAARLVGSPSGTL